MSGLHVLHIADLGSSIDEYIHRCDVLLEEAFFAGEGTREGFRSWVRQRFQSDDPVMLLHDAPLYVVCRYLGLQPTKIDPAIVDRAAKVAKSKGW